MVTRSLNSLSGVNYDILSFRENKLSGSTEIGIMDRKIGNKKKGVTEFEDLTRPFNPNFDRNYSSALEGNADIFKKYRGIFTYEYDAAHRNGNIVVPFRKVKKDEHKKSKPVSSNVINPITK